MTAPVKEILADGVELWLGDCRDVLPLIGKVDAVVTDPPYGIGEEYASFDDTEDNVLAAISMVVPWAISNSNVAFVTSGNGLQHKYPVPRWTLAWVTPAGIGSGPFGFSCWQPILAYGKCPYLSAGKGRHHDIIIHTESSEKNGHPCPKPIGFMKRLIERASFFGQVVLDPFMGSGTTGVASVNLGRKFIGIEIEPKYYDIARRRISEALKQPRLPLDEPKRAIQTSLLDGAS